MKVFFEASTPPDNVQGCTILYDGINMPGLVTLDLQCINEFPQDQISEETRAIVLMANATGFSFSMLNLLDTTKDASFLVLEERATTVCTIALIHQLTNF
jgi:hypothetical protein